MVPRFDFIGLVVADLATSLAFYRRLGLDIPLDADASPHVEVAFPGGLRMAWDTQETIRSFDESWSPPSGGHRVALAFACDSPADVDVNYLALVESGYNDHPPWDAFWGQRCASLSTPTATTSSCSPVGSLHEYCGGTPAMSSLRDKWDWSA
jgi:catechol 2,3-dioxygenase-like lactoylglutathione lyase family enzyme